MNMVLRVAFPAGALEPGRDNRPGRLEPAWLAAVDPGALVTGAGDPSPGLQVLQRRPVGPVQDLLERLLEPCPVHGGLLVSGRAGVALIFPERCVQHRDGLGERNRHVGVGGGWRVAWTALRSSSMSRLVVACGSAVFSRAG